jgi:hypothetical protein
MKQLRRAIIPRTAASSGCLNGRTTSRAADAGADLTILHDRRLATGVQVYRAFGPRRAARVDIRVVVDAAVSIVHSSVYHVGPAQDTPAR